MWLLNVLLQEYGAVKGAESTGIDVKTVSVGTARAEILRQKDTALGTVVENRVISGLNAPAKRHIGACASRLDCELLSYGDQSEFDLPDSMTYRAGDYLAMCVPFTISWVTYAKADSQSAYQPRSRCAQGDCSLWAVN